MNRALGLGITIAHEINEWANFVQTTNVLAIVIEDIEMIVT
jgi:hypothetical protein